MEKGVRTEAVLDQQWSRYWSSFIAATLGQYWVSTAEMVEWNWSSAAAAWEPGALEQYWRSMRGALRGDFEQYSESIR